MSVEQSSQPSPHVEASEEELSPEERSPKESSKQTLRETTSRTKDHAGRVQPPQTRRRALVVEDCLGTGKRPTNLQFVGWGLQDIACLGTVDLGRLKSLDLTNNKLIDVSLLCTGDAAIRFSCLEAFKVGQNLLFGALEISFPKLRHLEMQRNLLTRIPDVTQCDGLEYLDVSENHLNHADLDSLGFLTSLATLKVGGNPFSDLDPLQMCQQLDYLYGTGVQLNVFEIKNVIAGFTDMTWTSLLRSHPSLYQIDGVDISEELRDAVLAAEPTAVPPNEGVWVPDPDRLQTMFEQSFLRADMSVMTHASFDVEFSGGFKKIVLDTLKRGGTQQSVECIQRIHIALDYMETLSQDVRLSLMTKDTDPRDIGGLKDAVYLYVDDLMCQGLIASMLVRLLIIPWDELITEVFAVIHTLLSVAPLHAERVFPPLSGILPKICTEIRGDTRVPVDFKTPHVQLLLKGLRQFRGSTLLSKALLSISTVLAQWVRQTPTHIPLLKTVSLLCYQNPKAVSDLVALRVHVSLAKTLTELSEFRFDHPGHQQVEVLFIMILQTLGNMAPHSQQIAHELTRQRDVHIAVLFPELRELLRSPTHLLDIQERILASSLLCAIMGIAEGASKENLTRMVDTAFLVDIVLVILKEKPCASGASLVYALKGLDTILRQDELSRAHWSYLGQYFKSMKPLVDYVDQTSNQLLALFSAEDQRATHAATGWGGHSDTDHVAVLHAPVVYKVVESAVRCIRRVLFRSNINIDLQHAIDVAEEKGRLVPLLFSWLSHPNEDLLREVMRLLEVSDLESWSEDAVAVLTRMAGALRDATTSVRLHLLSSCVTLVSRVVVAYNERAFNPKIKKLIDSLTSGETLQSFVMRIIEFGVSFFQSKVRNLTDLPLAPLFFNIRVLFYEMRANFHHILQNRLVLGVFADCLSCEYKATDIWEDSFFEQAWAGRNAAVMTKLLRNMHNPQSTVVFRLLLRLGHIFSGHPEDSYRRTDMIVKLYAHISGIQLRCQQVQAMWNDSQLADANLLLSQEEAADQTDQLAASLVFKLPDTLVCILSSLISSRTSVNVPALKMWAGWLKGHKEDVELKIAQGAQVFSDELHVDNESLDLFFDQPQAPPGSQQRGDYEGFWMTHQAAQMHNKDIEMSRVSRPHDLLYRFSVFTEEIWLSHRLQHLRPEFVLTSALTIFYVAILYQPDAEVAREYRQAVSTEAVVGLLCRLLVSSDVSLLSCNVGAKICRLLSTALRPEPGTLTLSMDWIIQYRVVTQYLRPVLAGAAVVVERGSELTVTEMRFIAELVRLFTVVIQQTPQIKFSIYQEVQQWCVESCLNVFVDRSTIDALVSLIIFTLKVDAGGTSGRFTGHLQQSSSTLREDMRESACRALAVLSSTCSFFRLPVTRSIIENEVVKQFPLRRSFLFEFFQAIQMQDLITNREILMAAEKEVAERVVMTEVVEWTFEGSEVHALVVLSSEGLTVLDKPTKVRNHDAPTLMSPEDYQDFGEELSFVAWKELKTIYWGFHANYLAVVCLSGDSHIFCFERVNAVNEFGMLCRDLAFSLGNAIVDCLKDSVTMYCLREVLSVYLIRAALLAKYEGETVLVVISGPDFCIFRVDWSAWFPAGLSFTDTIAVSWYQADHTPCVGLEDADVAEGEGLANFIFVHEQATKPVELTRAANIVEELPIWVGPIIHGVEEQEFKRKLIEAKEAFLTVLVHEKLTQLRDVTFEASSSRAEVSLGFQPTEQEESKESSGNLSDESLEESFDPDYDDSDTSSAPMAEPKREVYALTFLDDVSRERFKTGIAAWMSRSMYTSKWKRRFNNV